MRSQNATRPPQAVLTFLSRWRSILVRASLSPPGHTAVGRPSMSKPEDSETSHNSHGGELGNRDDTSKRTGPWSHGSDLRPSQRKEAMFTSDISHRLLHPPVPIFPPPPVPTSLLLPPPVPTSLLHPPMPTSRLLSPPVPTSSLHLSTPPSSFFLPRPPPVCPHLPSPNSTSTNYLFLSLLVASPPTCLCSPPVPTYLSRPPSVPPPPTH